MQNVVAVFLQTARDKVVLFAEGRIPVQSAQAVVTKRPGTVEGSDSHGRDGSYADVNPRRCDV